MTTLTDRDSVAQLVIEEAERQKLELKEELQNKFVYLQFDCATKQVF
jgi:hypothetical protein